MSRRLLIELYFVLRPLYFLNKDTYTVVMSRIALRAASSARLAASIRPASLIPLYSVARSSALSAHGILASDVQRFLSRQYSASTAAKQQATGPAGETSSAKDGGKPNEGAEEQANEEQYNDEAYYADEPLAARVSRCA